MRTLLALLAAVTLAVPADARTRLRKPAKGFQMKMGRYVIQPGADVEVCEYRRLPIKRGMDVSGFTLRMPPGAHHFALWGYGGGLGDDAFARGPVENVGCIRPETTDEMCFAMGFFHRTTAEPAEIRGDGCFASDHGLLCPFAPAIAP